MKTLILRIAALAAVLVLPATQLEAAKKTFRERLADKLATCEYSFEVVMSKPESTVPIEVIQQAKGIVIVHQYRVGFIVGGQGGSAIMMARNPRSGKWGPPVFLDPGGINFGLQAGANEINSIFVLMSDQAVQKAYSGRFDLGADAVAVAGPRNAESENFDLFKADVFVYTSLGGLFAGASVKTGWIKPYDKGNRELYNTSHTIAEIVLSSWFEVPQEARPIYNRVAALDRAK